MQFVNQMETPSTRCRKAFLNYKNTQNITGGGGIKLACCVGKTIYGNDWFNTDIEENFKNNVYYLDITKEFPIESDTLNFVFIEHGVEHVDFEGLMSCFLECKRTLKSGGVLRFSTPSLENWLKYYFAGGDFVKFITQFATQGFMPQMASIGLYSKALVINNALRNWGHKLVLDFATYSEILQGVGFHDIKQVPLRQSEHPELQNLERHAMDGPLKVYNDFEIMVIEATK